MKRQSIRDGVFTVAGVLSSDECTELIARAEVHGFEIATINTRHGAEVDADFRNNDRVILDDPALANQLWVRISSVVPSLVAGRQARGVNERFRFYRYVPGQKFSWHTDGYFERVNGERSLLTFMVYLNEGYEGGATEFVKKLEELFVRSVSPGAHWVRVFLASFHRKSAGADVLLDNEPWPDGAALLHGWDWAFPEEYRSLRHFFVAVPDAR